MNNTKIFGLIVCLWLICQTGFAQTVSTGYGNFLPPSPGAGAAVGGGGMSQGMSGTSIPLGNFSTNTLTVPVTLSYYSTGTKVDQLASNVGLGWSLHAGGVITRTVRDDRDEISQLSYPSEIDSLSLETLDFIEDATDTSQFFDTEPDLFSFSFAGYSGSFVFDTAGVVRIMPFQKLHVETNDSLDYFHITTPDGIEYRFGGSGAIETSKSENTGSTCQTTASSYADSIKTAWYLKTIIHPVNGQIDFEYETNTYTYTAGKTQTIYEYLENSSTPPQGQESQCVTYSPEKCDIEITIDEISLTKISATHFGSINFDSNIRSNVGNLRLDEMVVKNTAGDTLRKVSLSYDYSINNRMFLTQITEKDVNDKQEAVYVFDYYDIDQLPTRLNFRQDHWGYFNGKTNGSDLIPAYDTLADGGDAAKANVFLGIDEKADRSPDADYAKYGMLKSIVYPSTLFTTFEYEGNLLSDSTYAGGLRLQRIVNHDPVTGQKDSTRYHYGPANDPDASSGSVTIKPNFWSYYSEFTNVKENTNASCEFFDCVYASIQSSSLNTLYNSSGHHVSYEYVTITKGEGLENGGVTYKYLLAADSTGRIVHGENINGLPLSNVGWQDGLLSTVETFKLDGNDNPLVLQKTSYTYEMDSANYTVVPAAVVRKTLDNPCEEDIVIPCTSENTQKEYLIFCRANHTHNYSGPIGECIAEDHDNYIKLIAIPPCDGLQAGVDTVVYSNVLNNVDVVEYYNYSFWQYLKSTTSYNYDENGANPVSTTVTYNYDSAGHAQLTSVTSNASIDGTIKTRYVYPEDYGSNAGAAIDSLISRHITGIPIESIKSVAGDVVAAGATKFVFDTGLDAVVPESFYAFEDDGNGFTGSTDGITFTDYEKKGEILKRDSLGQVISQRAENNVVSTVIRGYDQTLVVASITNATWDEVKSALPALGNNLSAGTGALSNNDIDTLRTELSDALITTYTYKIGFGVETVTDPNGRTVTYVYDDFGRVEYVKDHDGNIRSASEYHNTSQTSN